MTDPQRLTRVGLLGLALAVALNLGAPWLLGRDAAAQGAGEMATLCSLSDERSRASCEAQLRGFLRLIREVHRREIEPRRFCLPAGTGLDDIRQAFIVTAASPAWVGHGAYDALKAALKHTWPCEAV